MITPPPETSHTTPCSSHETSPRLLTAMKHLTFTALLRTPRKPEIEIVLQPGCLIISSWSIHKCLCLQFWRSSFLPQKYLKTAIIMVAMICSKKLHWLVWRWHWQNHLVTDEKCFRRSPFYETAMTTGVSEKHLLHCYLFFSLDDAKATLSFNKKTKALTQQCIMNCGVWPSLPNPVESLSYVIFVTNATNIFV